MKLVTQTLELAKKAGDEECIRMIAGAGFDALDWSFMGMETGQSIWCGEEFREHALRLKEIGDSCGVSFTQAHAPFPSSKGEEDYDTAIRKWILRAMEAASLLGVEEIVVHPRKHLPYLQNRERLFQENLDFYRSLIPWCERYDIRVCIENMWQREGKTGYIVRSVCADPEEFSRLLDELDSPWVGGCLDLGHCALTGWEPEESVRMIGGRRIRALHVHDVDYVHDCHTMPFLEKINWDAVAGALAQVGYEGNFTLEADCFFRKMPLELIPEALRLMERTGRYLIRKIEDQKGTEFHNRSECH